jgi:hypothetical protein
MKQLKLGQMHDDLSRGKQLNSKTSMVREMNARKKEGESSEPSRFSFAHLFYLLSPFLSSVCHGISKFWYEQ